MRGKPKYKEGQTVVFKLGDQTLTGEIFIVDKYGTFENPTDASYDIMVKQCEHKVCATFPDGHTETKTIIDDCFYKHITESLILHGKKKKRNSTSTG